MSPLLIQLGLSAANAGGTALYNGITGDIENNVNNPAISNYITNVSAINSQIAEQQAFDAVNSNLQDFSNVSNNDSLLNLGIQQTSTVNEPNGWQNIGMYTGKQLQNLGNLDIVGTYDTAIQMYKDLFNIGNDSKADKINKEITRVNKQNIDNFYDQVKNNNQRQLREWFMHQSAEGGYLNELNGVTKFNVGGSHSENNYGGIQQGIAPDGLPNEVEEGEIKYKDYIYSARLKPSKSMLKEFNLPEKYVGKTFAELADILQQESKDRPNDPVSLQTLDDWMSRLAGAQEEYKAKQEERRLAKVIDNMSDEEKAALMSSLGQPMAQEGIDLGQPMYKSGGKIYIKPENRGKFTASAKRAGMGVQEFARHVLANKEDYSSTQVKRANFARNFGGHKHAGGGHLAESGRSLNIPNNDNLLQNLAFITALNNSVPYNMYSGYNNAMNVQDKLNEFKVNLPSTSNNSISLVPETTISETLDDALSFKPITIPKDSKLDNNINLSSLRYAPALGAALGALEARLQPKDYTLANELRDIASQYKPISAPHIGGYRRYTPYDVNLGDAENIALTARALEANRGQNRATQGALNTAVLNAAQKTAAARNLAAQQANEANRLAVDTYNLGIDQFNAQRDTQYDQLNQQILNNRLRTLMSAAQAEDDSRTAWAQNVSGTTENMYNQLGNVGRDEWNRNQRDIYLRDLGYDPVALLSLFNLNKG